MGFVGGNSRAYGVVGAAIHTDQGWIPIALNRRSAETIKSLARQIEPPERRSAREGGSQLVQLVNDGVGQNVPYRLLGEVPPYVAFTPDSLQVTGSLFSHIVPDVTFPVSTAGKFDYVWTLPASSISSVALDDPEPGRIQLIPSDGTVRLTYEYTTRPGPETDGLSVTLFTIEVFLQDQSVLTLTDIPSRHQPDSAPAFPLTPLFGCGLSGPYNLSMVVDGQTILNESYLQRGLRFTPDLPDLTGSGEQPVSVDSLFDWDFGSGGVGGARWSVNIYDAAGRRAESAVPETDGNHVHFTWDPNNLAFLPRHNGPPVDPPVLSYQVKAQANSYPSPGGFVPYIIFRGARADGSRAVAIGASLFPDDSFDPSLGDSIELRAGIGTFGYDHPDVHWLVRVVGPGGTVLKNYSSPETASSHSIFIGWDGLEQDGARARPGEYKFSIHAEACEGEDEGIVDGRLQQRHTGLALFCESADKDVPFTVLGPTEEVADSIEVIDELTGEVVASSSPREVPAGLDPIAALDAFDIGPVAGTALTLSSSNDAVVPLGLNSTRALTIRYFAKKTPGVTLPAQVSVSVATSISANQLSLDLPLQTETASAGKYEHSITLASGSASGDVHVQVSTDPKELSYSTFDSTTQFGPSTSIDDSGAQDSLLFERQEGSHRKLGRAWELTAEERLSTAYRRDKTINSKDAFQAAGFEDLVVERRGLRAWTRVKNQARRFYVSGHGSRGSLFLEHGRVEPADIQQDWQDNLDVVIFAGCSALNIGNFNGWAGYDYSAGNEWVSKLRANGILLGYNATAPLGNTDEPPGSQHADTRVLSRYDQFLLSDPSREDRAMAWLLANASMEVRLADDACAVTRDYYYFIHYIPTISGTNTRAVDPHDQVNPNVVNRERAIWRIHKSLWSRMGSEQFSQVMQTGNELLVKKMRALPDARQGEAEKI